MRRIHRRYSFCLCLQVILILILLNTGMAAQGDKTEQNKKVPGAAAEAQKVIEAKKTLDAAAAGVQKAVEIKKAEATPEAQKTGDVNKALEAAADTQKTAAQATAGAATEGVKTGESSEEVKNYIYDPTDKTDPFKSFIAAKVQETGKGKTKTYLETLELSQLELMAIIVGPKGKWAMVKDSKGLGHVIKEGTPIGTNSGVVYKISQDQVIIREEYVNFKGETQYREVIKVTQSNM